MKTRFFAILIFIFCVEARPDTTVKVAILDNNFSGFKDAHYLPEGTTYHAGSVDSPEDTEPHGLFMAELLVKFLKGQGGHKIPYELHLYKTYGYTNFKEAVEDVIHNHFHIVLYPQVWEYGGNGSGQGFINAVVNQAVDAGIIWVNAAGNFGQGTFTYKITAGDDGWVSLPESGLPVLCHDPRGCDLRAVLSWNDFSNDVDQGTNKDLDLFLYNQSGDQIASSELVQRRMLDKNSDKFSKYPREIIETKIHSGESFLKVKTTSHAWTDEDRLKITVSGSGIETFSNSTAESLLNPADNPKVVTVGSCDTSDSSISVSQRKPELIAPTIVNLPPNLKYMGTSVAATLVAAGAVALRSINDGMTKESFLDLVSLHRGERRPAFQWNTPNYSMCRPPQVDFAKLFIMPSF